MSRISSSALVERLGAQKFFERLAFHGVKSGFQIAGATSRQFQSVTKLMQAERLEKPKSNADLFDINISEEQQMIRESVRSLAMEVLRPAAEKADEEKLTSQEVISKVAELGLMFYAIPETFGGAGMERSPLTSMLIAEDLAYGDMGQATSILSSIGVANALTQWGSAEQQSKYLAAFLDEAKPLQASIAVNEPTALFNPNKLSTTATSTADGFILNGVKSLVPIAAQAELFLVAADLDDKGPQIFVIESSTKGLSIEEDIGMGVRAASLAKLRLDKVSIKKDALLGEGIANEEEAFSYQSFIDYARLSWCAMAIGCSQGVLEYVTTYVNEREAFGEPISHRQSVAFMVANIGIELEGMRVLTQRAVSLAENNQDFHKAAFLARVACGDKAMEIGTNGVQLLGGHGFTKEHPVERWYRDLRAIAIMEGGLHL
jgi:alkylation response protein AidB-like acyl-CoA dehydrogenase